MFSAWENPCEYFLHPSGVFSTALPSSCRMHTHEHTHTCVRKTAECKSNHTGQFSDSVSGSEKESEWEWESAKDAARLNIKRIELNFIDKLVCVCRSLGSQWGSFIIDCDSVCVFLGVFVQFRRGLVPSAQKKTAAQLKNLTKTEKQVSYARDNALL